MDLKSKSAISGVLVGLIGSGVVLIIFAISHCSHSDTRPSQMHFGVVRPQHPAVDDARLAR